MSYLELEWYWEDADDYIREGEVCDEEVGDGSHSPVPHHHVDHQGVALN